MPLLSLPLQVTGKVRLLVRPGNTATSLVGGLLSMVTCSADDAWLARDPSETKFVTAN